MLVVFRTALEAFGSKASVPLQHGSPLEDSASASSSSVAESSSGSSASVASSGFS